VDVEPVLVRRQPRKSSVLQRGVLAQNASPVKLELSLNLIGISNEPL